MTNSLYSLVSNPAHHGLNRIVARDGTTAITGADLLHETSHWRDRLAAISETAILLHLPRGEKLLAALLAMWQLGKTAVLATSSPNAVMRALNLPSADSVAGELSRGIPESHLPTCANMQLVLFTSGSSGTPVPIAKSLAQLDAELDLLDRVWGDKVGDSVFVSGVSRHHMFGLPFGLLWPLSRGNAFLVNTILYAESLETLARQGATMTLVTSPGQLDNLPPNLDWPLLRTHLSHIFCAGAPLSMETARFCRDQLIPVTEIYGSTETGAVAWREQTTDLLWRCLPDVAVTIEAAPESSEPVGPLYITSPYTHPEDTTALAMADIGRLHPNARFELLGRIDRIVKIGGHRVSLAAVETCLLSHPWVSTAKVLPLPQRKGRLGAVVVLSGAGRDALVDKGRGILNRSLSSHLTPYLENVAVPRYWRYVGHLPLDAQGKTVLSELQDLFLTERQPRLPEVLEIQIDDEPDSAVLSLRIPYTLFYFSGHFPGNPVLPGVVQLEWALHHANNIFDGLGELSRLESLKFQHIIQPGDLVNLALNWDTSRSRLTFVYSSALHNYSSGRVVFNKP